MLVSNASHRGACCDLLGWGWCSHRGLCWPSSFYPTSAHTFGQVEVCSPQPNCSYSFWESPVPQQSTATAPLWIAAGDQLLEPISHSKDLSQILCFVSLFVEKRSAARERWDDTCQDFIVYILLQREENQVLQKLWLLSVETEIALWFMMIWCFQ